MAELSEAGKAWLLEEAARQQRDRAEKWRAKIGGRIAKPPGARLGRRERTPTR